jgi:hypothetical protein
MLFYWMEIAGKRIMEIGNMRRHVESSGNVHSPGTDIVNSDRNAPDIVQKHRAQLLDPADPLSFSGIQMQPSVENRLSANSSVEILFRIYNLSQSIAQSDHVATANLLDQKGVNFALAPIQLKEMIFPAGPTEAVVLLRLSFQNVPAGKYRLAIEIADGGSTQPATLQSDLEFY